MKDLKTTKALMARSAVNRYEDHLQSYDKSGANSQGLEGIAAQAAIRANEMDTVMEKDPKVLKDLIGSDVRDAVPPQIYTVISDIVKLIEELEQDDDNEGQ